MKTDGCGWDIGGRIDLSYGTDWRYGDCYGLENHIDAKHDLYGLVIPQFYLEVAYNDLTVKMGHYAACMGYEIVPAPGNFFYSHSYALGYSEPILATGVRPITSSTRTGTSSAASMTASTCSRTRTISSISWAG